MYAAAASASGSALASAPAAGATAPSAPRGAVIYRSSALAATAPALVSAVDSRESARVPAIAKAHALAESVREQFKKRGRTRTNAASSSSAASAGSEEAEKAGRYDRRLKMNRQSAAASRVRREAYIKALEAQLVAEDKRGRELEAELQAERAAHQRLREEIAAGVLLPAPAPPAPPDVSMSAPAPEVGQTAAETAAQPVQMIELPVPVTADAVLDLDNVLPVPPLEGIVKFEPEPLPLPEAFLTAQQPMKNEFSGLDFAEAPFPFTEVDPEDPAAAIEELMNLSSGS